MTHPTVTVTAHRNPLTRQWRWRARTSNNRIIAHSGESYHHLDDCLHAVNLVFGDTPTRLIVDGRPAGNRVLR